MMTSSWRPRWICRLWLRRSPTFPRTSEEPKDGDVAQVEALLQIPLDPDAASDGYGTTPLMRAATWGNVDVAGLLLEADAQVSLRSDTDYTALTLAAREGHPEVVQLLLAAGSEKELIDEYGLSALMYAGRHGQAEVAEVLLEAGAQVDLCNKDGWTSLMFAARCGHARVVGLLLAANSKWDSVDKDGRTALMMVSDGRELEVRNEVRLLLLEAAWA
ncbi:ANKRD29 [Symbiodinium sp. CCMP2592]|nr:ANKRD29 [Symbiodinium sp. CCMP2592]